MANGSRPNSADRRPVNEDPPHNPRHVRTRDCATTSL